MKTRQAELLKALSVESRIKIIELLKQKGPMGANEISKLLSISPSAVSQHLKVLRYAGLVHNERKGYWLPYDIDHAAMGRCQEIITEICNCGCGGTCRARSGGKDDNLAALKRRERKLQRELQEVKARINELQAKT
jgi:DNA-binding transcriptional ArsR family regulator